jgi:hypothetical protein
MQHRAVVVCTILAAVAAATSALAAPYQGL